MMNMAVFTFKKDERLKKKKQIEQLFSSGQSFFVYPYKVVWLMTDSDLPVPAQILVSASRRALKRAVDRNKVKRQFREVYRYNKQEIYDFLEDKEKSALIGVIYTGHEILPFEDAREKIKQLLIRLLKEIKKHYDQ